MLVTRDDLEARLAALRQMVDDPTVGIHGPGSHAWELKRESINFVGGARAALLQLAHPYVAHGIDQHSKTRTDIQGRFQRTFTNVFAMTFGDLDQAFHAARRVHSVHRRIRGEITEDVGPFLRGHHYEANDADALTWVWATLIDTIITVNQRYVRRLSPPFLERFYQETKRFAYLFGLSDEQLPPDYPGFRRYVDLMFASDTLTVGTQAREMASFLLAAPSPRLRPVFAWYRAVTAGLMPPRLRLGFDLSWGPAERAMFRASTPIIRGAYAVTPRALRYLPAYVEARSRVDGREPGRLAGLTYRLAVRGARVAG